MLFKTKSDIIFFEKSPSFKALAKGTIFKDRIIEVEIAVAGDVKDGINKWYRDKMGHFYWAGALEEIKSDAPTDVLVDWRMNSPQIPKPWLEAGGEGVHIAVLDTGVDNLHPDLQGRIYRIYDCLNDVKGIAPDTIGHGTHVVGLIAAQTASTFGVRGLAPKARISVYKVIDENANAGTAPIIKGLKLAISERVDIINLSLDIDASLIDDEIKNLIKMAHSQGIVVVAAAGDNMDLADGNIKGIPQLTGCLSVGTIQPGFVQLRPDNQYAAALTLVAPQTKYWSCFATNRQPYQKLSGTSMATALCSAVIALLKSNIRKNAPHNLAAFNRDMAREELLRIAPPVTEIVFNQPTQFRFYKP